MTNENQARASGGKSLPSSYKSKILDLLANPPGESGDLLPWKFATDKFRLRRGELTIWHGYSGSGKSIVLGQIINGLAQQQAKTSLMSLEMNPESVVYRMCMQAAGKQSPGEEYLDKYLAWMDQYLIVYDNWYPMTSLGALEWMQEHYIEDVVENYWEADHFFFDPLSMIKVVNEADRQLVDMGQFITNMSQSAHNNNIGVHIVHHARKPGTAQLAKDPPDKVDVRGAAEITDLADNVVCLYRNLYKEAGLAKQLRGAKLTDREKIEVENPDFYLIVQKQRHHQWTGWIGLYWDNDSMQLSERVVGKQGVIDL